MQAGPLPRAGQLGRAHLGRDDGLGLSESGPPEEASGKAVEPGMEFSGTGRCHR